MRRAVRLRGFAGFRSSQFVQRGEKVTDTNGNKWPAFSVTFECSGADYTMTAMGKCHTVQPKPVNHSPSNFQEHFMDKQHLITIALGSAFAAATLLPVHAAGNPFAAKTLDAGYQVAQADTKAKDGKCGEGKCGGDKKATKAKDGKCGEGKCGGDKKATKAKDGKCGEGKCGGDKKK